MLNLQQPSLAPKFTLASLKQVIANRDDFTAAQRSEMASAINTACKVFGQAPHLVSADAMTLRPMLHAALPMAQGVSADRWANVKSLVIKALGLADPAVIPARKNGSLLPAWTALLGLPEAHEFNRGLARFSKRCSAQGTGPDAVTQAVYDTYYDDLAAHGMMRSPREAHQLTGHTWNKAVNSVPGWPQTTLVIQNFRHNRSLAWDAFPASFSADVESFLWERSSDNPFDLKSTHRPMRPATITGKRAQIRQFASALVESGYSPECITGLADLVDTHAVNAGLTLLWQRAGGVKTTRIHAMAYMLLSIARHWVHADVASIAALKTQCKKLAPKTKGLTSKNRKRLRQFANPASLKALLDLPAQLFAEAARIKPPTVAEARAAQLGLAIEILLVAPLRIKNVAELEVGRTLIISGKRIAHIVIDAAEVKNDVDIEVPLPPRVAAMVATYMKNYHHLLAPPGCKMLFPSADGGHKRTSVLSNQITKIIARRCGVDMNSHLFRHLAAKLYLDANPGAYGLIRMLLGHKSVETTTAYYCGLEFGSAFVAYDAILTGRRAELAQIGGGAKSMQGRR